MYVRKCNLDVQQRSIMYVRKCRTTYTSVASCMWGSAKSHTAALHHICEEVQDDIQWSFIMYVRKCKTTYTSVASCM